MVESDTHVEGRRFSRFFWINFPIFVCIVISAATAIAIYNYSFYYYSHAKAQAISRAQETIRRVAMDVTQVFYSYDSILKSSIALLGDDAIATLSEPTKNRLMGRMVSQFPYVASIVFLDGAGAVQISSGGEGLAQRSYALEDFFREQVSGALVGPFLAFSVGTWFDRPDYQIAISRRMTYDGQFKGVGVAFIRLSDFRDQFTNINIDAGNMIALMHESGHVLTRRPSKDGRGDFGDELPKADRERLATASEGTFVATSPVDGRTRLFVFQHLPDWPLELVFGVPVSVVDGEWRHRMSLTGTGAALVCAILLFLSLRLRRERIRRVDAEDQLALLSMTDFLTGLPNRRRFDEVIQREYRRAQRTDAWLSVAIIDADRFKALNDHFGHAAGDETLKMIANAIAHNARRATDLAARLGGEEFALVLPDTSAAAAFEIVERIRRTMEDHLRREAGPPCTTISAGIACTKDRPAPASVDALIEAADQALYRAKHGGRNRTELSTAVSPVPVAATEPTPDPDPRPGSCLSDGLDASASDTRQGRHTMADAARDADRSGAPQAEGTPVGKAASPRILALTGADREAIQALLAAAAAAFRAAGYRVIGVIEEIEPNSTQVALRDLASGSAHPLTQDLGSGSAGCSLDAAGLAAACGEVEAAIGAVVAAGADPSGTVVILSKFGRQEAEGRGLTHAFHAAVAADLPILTSVSPTVAAAWATFAGDLAGIAPVELSAVEAWGCALRTPSEPTRAPDRALVASMG